MGRPKRAQRFKVTRFTNPSGKVAWRVSGSTIAGVRIRENFQEKGDALERMSELEHESGATNQSVALQRTTLSSEQIADAESAYSILETGFLAEQSANVRRWEQHCKSLGLTIDEALAFCASRYRPELKEMTIMQARELFLASRRGIRPKTRNHYESATLRLLKPDPNKLVHRFTVGDLEKILESYSNPNSYRTYRRCFGTFFRWATRKHLCMENPSDRLDLPPSDSTDVAVLPLDETKRLLRAAVAYKRGEMVAAITIGLFAGLRPSELQDLKPANVTEERIRVTGGKLRRELKRTVPVSANLGLWLAAYPFKGLPKNFWGKLRTLRKAVKPVKWVQDIIRHTSISFQLERDKNEALTAFNNGTSPKMIEFHYRDVIGDDSAITDFWSTTPSSIRELALPEGLPSAALVAWPEDEKIRAMIAHRSLRQVARELGVSDVALRKRCLKQGIELPRKRTTPAVRESAA